MESFAPNFKRARVILTGRGMTNFRITEADKKMQAIILNVALVFFGDFATAAGASISLVDRERNSRRLVIIPYTASPHRTHSW